MNLTLDRKLEIFCFYIAVKAKYPNKSTCWKYQLERLGRF